VRTSANKTMSQQRLCLKIQGAVQGVGFRPFVYRLATELHLTGWVNNNAQGVAIEVEGSTCQLHLFQERLQQEKPVRSQIHSTIGEWKEPLNYQIFEIRESSDPSADNLHAKTAVILPDIATCADCLRDLFDAANRRDRYPFTNCTNCGPRYSIITALPYDRRNTTMHDFQMCADCEAEYHNPLDRRFHAQPNACPRCGPQLELWNRDGQVLATGDRALLETTQAIRSGKILAIKGLGGFHLVVDAANLEAVTKLRKCKHRPDKPLALMYPNLESIQADCQVSELEAQLLRSPEAPIVLLQKLPQNNRLHQISPHNSCIGAMLPYTPLHHLLMAELQFPIVATSGNLSDEPICIDNQEAIANLGNIADLFLLHNRAISQPVDDSVVRVMGDRPVLLRRARGYAPLPIIISSTKVGWEHPEFANISVGAKHDRSKSLVLTNNLSAVMLRPYKIGMLPVGFGFAQPMLTEQSQIIQDFNYQKSPQNILALGGHLKNAIAFSIRQEGQPQGDCPYPITNSTFCRDSLPVPALDINSIVISQHIGDLETTKAFEHFQRIINQLSEAYEFHPEAIACDAHPDYVSSQYAQQLSQSLQILLIPVQHHYAHVLAGMADNQLQPPILGIAWDGTGYGTDGTIWGGEFLKVTDSGFERVAHLRRFKLLGGDKAAKEPRRSALGILWEMFGDRLWNMDLEPLQAFTNSELAILKTLLTKQLATPQTSSMGRLFDAVASLLNICQIASFEGQAAIALEALCDRANTFDFYHKFNLRFNVKNNVEIDWSPLIQAILEDMRNKVDVETIAAKFHNSLVEAIALVAKQIGIEQIVLTGGCFQNRYLTERAMQKLQQSGFQPYCHHQIPPNDGGIAAGQIMAVLREHLSP
jgi:hydrogenase maturation protein HypF